MAYGQKNYNEIQGINGKYRINQIGCFLTSFSNLLERFGKGIDPIQLNAALRDRGIYIDVDDGIRDDLGWGSISAYNGNIVVRRSGNNSAVPSRNCIVRIKANNSFGTHFCLVDRIEGSTVFIVDSWDGQVKKSSVYGPITGWAEYANNTPIPVQPVKPPAPAPAPAPEVDYVVVKAQAGYGISHLLRDAGYSQAEFGNQAEWERFGQLNGTKSIKLGVSYKVYKKSLGSPASAPAPAPQPSPEPEIVNITVQSGWGISHVLKAAGYQQASFERPDEWLRFSKLNGAPEGQNIRLQPNQIVKVYRTPLPAPQPVPAPEPPKEVPVTVTQPAPEPEKPKADPDTLVLAKPGWKTTYKADNKVYIATDSIVVKDQAGIQMDLQLVKGQKVTGAGTFEKNDVKYVRTQKSVDNDWWYGIPVASLSSGQDPDKYTGPLLEDEDDDSIFDLPMDLADEAKELYKNLSSREKLVAVVGKVEGFLLRAVNFFNVFKKKTEK